jgi:hypothetical protein
VGSFSAAFDLNLMRQLELFSILKFLTLIFIDASKVVLQKATWLTFGHEHHSHGILFCCWDFKITYFFKKIMRDIK